MYWQLVRYVEAGFHDNQVLTEARQLTQPNSRGFA